MSGITILNTYLLLFTCGDIQWIIPHTIFNNENKQSVAGICFGVFQAWAWLISQTIDLAKRWWNLWEHNKINNRVKEIWDVERKMSECDGSLIVLWTISHFNRAVEWNSCGHEQPLCVINNSLVGWSWQKTFRSDWTVVFTGDALNHLFTRQRSWLSSFRISIITDARTLPEGKPSRNRTRTMSSPTWKASM